MKYSLYVGSFFLAGFYISYKMSDGNMLANPIKVIGKSMKLFGFTPLDTVVFMSIPYINLVSSLFYFMSFKKEAARISKVCLCLTDLNKKLYELSDAAVAMPKQSPTKRALKLILLEACFVGFISISTVLGWLVMLKEGVFKHIGTSDVQTSIFLIVFGIGNFPYIYPCVAISADFMVCHLLKEVGETFSSLNTILKKHRCQVEIKQLQSDWTGNQNENNDVTLKG